MDVWQRRDLLHPAENPERSVDFVITLTGRLTAPGAGGAVKVVLRYVPDAQTVPPGAFAAYLSALEDEAWDSHERLATTILQDVSNAIVPRWVQVVSRTGDGDARHQIMVEDRQPSWNNAELLLHLDPV